MSNIFGNSETQTATPVTPGLLSLATTEEAIEGIDPSKAMTPYTTSKKLEAVSSMVSAGVVGAISVHDDENNLCTVGTVEARLYKTSNYTGSLFDYIVAGNQFTIPLNTVRYIVVSYNNGTPEMQCIEDVTDINESDIIPVVSIVNDSSELHFRIFDYWANGALNKHNQRLVFTRKYLRESGLSISEYGTRYLTVSAGRIWYGIKRYVTTDVSTDANEHLYRWHHDPTAPANWITVKTSGSYNNTHFDDITLGLTEMTEGKYGVNWVYLLVSDDEYEIMTTKSRYEYVSLDSARLATIPPAPPLINSHCMLIGRILYLKNAATSVIESAYDINFTGSQISDHNSTTGLNGGQGGEYYHLTHSQHDTLTAGSNADSLHVHNLKSDKVLLPVAGNFAGLDINGNLTDSGKKPADYSEANHSHDSSYYTESEVDTLLLGKSSTDHLHDDRYYTESELDIALGSKAASVHTHSKSGISDFTETDYVHVTGNESIAGNKTFTGNQTVNGQTINPFGALTLSTTNNDVVIGNYKNLRITGPTANFTITGIAGGVDGREITLYNSVAFRMTINNDDSGSISANRILTMVGTTNVQSTTQGVVNLVYSGVDSRWIITGFQV